MFQAPPKAAPGMASMSPSAAPAMPPKGLTVPLSLLQTPDDDDNMQTPVEGDTGSCNVDYTVDSINGETATITPTSINGKPIGGEDAAPEDTEAAADETEGSELRSMALNS